MTLIKADRLHTLLQEIAQLEAVTMKSFFELGLRYEMLKEPKDNPLWKSSGTEAKTFEQWCENELHRSPEAINSYIRVKQKFYPVFIKLQANLPLPDFTRLVKACPHVKDNESAEIWLTNACLLPLEGWKNHLREARGQITTDSEHECEFEIFERCKVCGKWRG